MKRLVKNKRRKRLRVIEVSLDTETCKEVDIEPTSSKITDEVKPTCYAVGISLWFEKDTRELVKSIEPLSIKHVKDDKYISFWGADCIDRSLEYIDNLFQSYDIINLHVFNRTYDLSYLRPYLLTKYGSGALDNLKKQRGEVIYELYKLGKSKRLVIKDPYTLTRSSLEELTETFEGCKKEKLEDYDKWMKFSRKGLIEGYWTFVDSGIKWIEDKPICIEKCVWKDWKSVEDIETNYLFIDVSAIKLVHVYNQRMKWSLAKTFEDQKNVIVHSEDKKKLFKGVGTVGNLYIWLANQFFWVNEETPKILRKLGINITRTKDNRVFNTYKAVFQPPIDMLDKSVFKDQERSFLGGYTSGSWSPKWEASDEYPIAISLDINSEYPYIMSGDMPYGELLDEPPKDSAYIEVYVCRLQERGDEILWPEWKPKYSFLKQGVLGDHPVEKYITAEKLSKTPFFYLYPRYYNLIKKMCKNVPTIEIIQYKRVAPLLKDVIDFLQVEKKSASKYKKLKEDDPERIKLSVAYDATKRTLNSGYGKSCEKPKVGTTKWDPVREQDIDVVLWHEERDLIYTDNKPFDILSGGYIPMMGRAMILEAIIAIIEAGHKFLYSDTDSLTFAAKKGVDPFKGLEIDDTKMGAWKIEAFYTGFIWPLKAKKYYGWTHDKYLSKDSTGNKKFNEEYINKTIGEFLPEDINLKDVKYKKLAYSGIDRNKMQSILKHNPDLFLTLYDVNENILIRKASKDCKKTKYGNVIYWEDKELNKETYTYKSDGSKLKIGLKKITGVLIEDGCNNWKIIRNA